MADPTVLFICGSMNQTTMMHQIYDHLSDFNCYFSPYYSDGIINFFSKTELLNFSILGGQFRQRTIEYIAANNLKLDLGGKDRNYDIVVTCSDLIIPKNIRNKKVVLVQEGMTDPENFIYLLVKYLKFPRWLASTSTTGLSDAYDKFCVASPGYRKLFINKGVDPNKIVITGIPNFDNCKNYLRNNFPHKHYVLAATSDTRETYKYENRKKFIKKVVEIADGREIIFKLHPNENFKRSTKEINKYAPGALVYTSGNTEHMIANCDVLVTRFSSVVYVGLALGKKVYSEFDLEELKLLQPVQNGGKSANYIAELIRKMLRDEDIHVRYLPEINENESILSTIKRKSQNVYVRMRTKKILDIEQ